MKKLLVTLILTTGLLAGCFDQTKKFVCERDDYADKVSLTIKGNRAKVGAFDYPYQCGQPGNYRRFSVTEGCWDGVSDTKIEPQFMIQFDEVSGSLIQMFRGTETIPSGHYDYSCKKVD